MRIVALAGALLTAGCRSNATSSAATAVDAGVAVDAGEPAVGDGPRVARLATDDVIAVDAAPARDGVLFITAVARTKDNRARLYEWDVDAARVTAEHRIRYESAEVWRGDPVALRLATSDAHAYVAVQLRHGRRLLVHAYGREKGAIVEQGITTLPALGREPFGTTSTAEDGAVDVSIAAAPDSWLAVTYRPSPERPLELHLYATPKEDWAEVAHKSLHTERGSGDRAMHDIAFVGSRLFVAEHPSPSETRVSELAVPSLNPVHSYSILHASDARGVTELVAASSRLFVLDRGKLVEPLAQKESAAATDDVAVSAAGDGLSATGPGLIGSRGDAVAPLHGKALCTPTWSRATPVLVCAESPEGPSVVRFPALSR